MAGHEESENLWEFDCPQFVDFSAPHSLSIEDNADEWFEQEHEIQPRPPKSEEPITPEVTGEGQGRARRILRQRSANQDARPNGPKRVPCSKSKTNAAPTASATRKSGEASATKTVEITEEPQEQVSVAPIPDKAPTAQGTDSQRSTMGEPAVQEASSTETPLKEPVVLESASQEPALKAQAAQDVTSQEPDIQEPVEEPGTEKPATQESTTVDTASTKAALQETGVTKAVPRGSHALTKGRSLNNLCTDLEQWRMKTGRGLQHQKSFTGSSKPSAHTSPSESHGVRRSPRLHPPRGGLPTGVQADHSVEVVEMTRSTVLGGMEVQATVTSIQVQVSKTTGQKRQNSESARANPAKKLRRSRSVSRMEDEEPAGRRSQRCHTRGYSSGLATGSLKRQGAEPCCQGEDRTGDPKVAKLTIPTSPTEIKRTALTKPASASKGKTTEELELEEIEAKRRELSERLRENQETCKQALAGTTYQRPYSQREPTIPQGFNFQTDARIKPAPVPTDKPEIKPSEFIRTLRSQDKKSTASSALRGLTLPQPFRLTESRRQAGGGKAEGKGPSKFHSMAEGIVNFHKETPERFHSRPRTASGSRQAVRGRSQSPKLTVPKTPNLQTRGRYRPATIPSQKDLEDQEIEEMKKHQFQACPLNRKILENPNTGVPKVTAKPVTQPEEFHLSMEHRLKERAHPTEPEEKFEFHAQPVPKAILEGTNVVKKVKSAPLTIPQSPAFALKHRVRLPIEVPEETGEREAYKRSHAVPHSGTPFQPKLKHRYTVVEPFSFEGRPPPQGHSFREAEESMEKPKSQVVRSVRFPHSSVPFQPKLSHACTVPEPFTFEERDRQLLTRKEGKIQEILEEEQKAHEFKANPLPSLSPESLPPRKPRDPTCPEPFHLTIDERGAKYQEAFARKLEEQMQQMKESLKFKARPAEVVQKEPFIPHKSTKPLTDISERELNTERRAEQREDFELRKKQREAEMEAVKRRRQEEEVLREREEVAQLRHDLVHKANPVRHFRNVQIQPSDKPLTQAESPRFSERLRNKVRI